MFVLGVEGSKKRCASPPPKIISGTALTQYQYHTFSSKNFCSIRVNVSLCSLLASNMASLICKVDFFFLALDLYSCQNTVAFYCTIYAGQDIHVLLHCTLQVCQVAEVAIISYDCHVRQETATWHTCSLYNQKSMDFWYK